MEHLLNPLNDGRFEPKNYKPDSGHKPECPLYGIIEVANEFAGLDSSFYCGQMVEHVDNIGILSGRRGEDYNPHVICAELAKMLGAQIKILSVKTPDISDLQNKPVGDLTEKEIEAISFSRKLENEKDQILTRFKLATYNICRVHPEDDSKDVHLKPVNSPEDITSEDAIGTAKLFFKALIQQTPCPQVPQPSFSGEMS